MTLQDVIDAEIRRGQLTEKEIHFGENKVDPKRGLMHHEFCTVRPIGSENLPHLEISSVLMLVEFTPQLVHVMGDRKLLCLRDELRLQDLEFVRFIYD